MKEVVHVVDLDTLHKHCDPYAGMGEFILACSEFEFNPPQCDIWVTDGGGWAEKHERGHCEGYDHPNSDQMRNLLKRYQETR